MNPPHCNSCSSCSCSRSSSSSPSSSSSSPSRNLNKEGREIKPFVPCPGYRFCPTDGELIFHYLAKKVFGKQLPIQIIRECDVYRYDPHRLPRCQGELSNEKEEFYFTTEEPKPEGTLTIRTTPHGYWKQVGDVEMVRHEEQIVGFKKSFEFYWGDPPNGELSQWIMSEHRLNPRAFSHEPLHDPNVRDKILKTAVYRVGKIPPMEDAFVSPSPSPSVSPPPSSSSSSSSSSSDEQTPVDNQHGMTDLEAIEHLIKRAYSVPVPGEICTDRNPYTSDPPHLPLNTFISNRLTRSMGYFFMLSPEDLSEGQHPVRPTPNGCWLERGREEPIFHGRELVGFRKDFLFYWRTGPNPMTFSSNPPLFVAQCKWYGSEYRIDATASFCAVAPNHVLDKMKRGLLIRIQR